MSNYSKLVCEKLLQIKAIKLSPQNPFTWASGMRSPIYCDNRISLSHPEARATVKEGLAALASKFEGVSAIAGVATAGIAHGALLADKLNLPFSYVRSEAKSHGRQNKIEGELTANMNVLVVEDLISTGGSSLQVVNTLREEGINVLGLIAIFDYNFASTPETFSKHQVHYQSVTNYDELLNVASEFNYINEKQAAVLSSWRLDPAGWYEKNFEQFGE